MSKQGEEALATWLRIMENPRAHTREAIQFAGGDVSIALGGDHAFDVGPTLKKGYLEGKVPAGSAALYRLSTIGGAALCEALRLDPWLLDTPSTPEAEAAAFNERWPVGTEVTYWTGYREGPGRWGRTTSKALVNNSDRAVVFVELDPGGICLSHVEPVQ